MPTEALGICEAHARRYPVPVYSGMPDGGQSMGSLGLERETAYGKVMVRQNRDYA